MKVLMICTEKLPLPPIRGGAIQTYISGALPYLNEEHEITVLGVNDPELPDEETIDGIHYVRIPGQQFETYKEGATRFVESQSFDLIHIYNRPKLVLPIRQVAPHSKITLSMHNDMFKMEKINPEEAAKVINEVSKIVTISDYIGKVIREQYPQASSKLHTIYSGVDTDRFLPGNHSEMKEIRARIRRENGLEDKTVILFAGRLSRNKGVDRLVRALPELSKRHNNLALVIVGSKWFSQNDVTDYVAYVRALAKKLPIPVVNTGFVSPFEIQNWFAAADLFVCTSIWQEPLARVHYEAMAAGLPIVTTNRGGNAEVIQLGENGLLVENPEDPANFIEILDQLLADRNKMKRMGENGRQLAVSRYEWNRVASDILKVWSLAELTEQDLPDVSVQDDQMEAASIQDDLMDTPSIQDDQMEAASVQDDLMETPSIQDDQIEDDSTQTEETQIEKTPQKAKKKKNQKNKGKKSKGKKNTGKKNKGKKKSSNKVIQEEQTQEETHSKQQETTEIDSSEEVFQDSTQEVDADESVSEEEWLDEFFAAAANKVPLELTHLKDKGKSSTSKGSNKKYLLRSDLIRDIAN